jgi:hypothetical protein
MTSGPSPVHIHLLLSDFTVLVRTLAASNTGGFLIYFRHLSHLDDWSASSQRPLPTQNNTTQKHEDENLCLKRDWNPRSQDPSDQSLLLRPYGHCIGPYTYKKLKQSHFMPWRRFGQSGCIAPTHYWPQHLMGMVGVTPKPYITPGTHWAGGWVELGAGLDTDATGKFLCLCRGSNPCLSVFVVRHNTNCLLYHNKRK